MSAAEGVTTEATPQSAVVAEAAPSPVDTDAAVSTITPYVATYQAPAPSPVASAASSSSIWTAAFWKGAGERMLKTFLQTFIPSLIIGLGVSGDSTLNVFDAPWSAALVYSLGISLGATFLSLCTSIGNADFTAGK
jgi:hypothetical protein